MSWWLRLEPGVRCLQYNEICLYPEGLSLPFLYSDFFFWLQLYWGFLNISYTHLKWISHTHTHLQNHQQWQYYILGWSSVSMENALDTGISGLSDSNWEMLSIMNTVLETWHWLEGRWTGPKAKSNSASVVNALASGIRKRTKAECSCLWLSWGNGIISSVVEK